MDYKSRRDMNRIQASNQDRLGPALGGDSNNVRGAGDNVISKRYAQDTANGAVRKEFVI
jgi:hypothetical protein